MVRGESRHCIIIVKSFRGWRKFSGGQPVAIKTGICSRQDAKNAKSGSFSFFAAFAPLREIFRGLVAALVPPPLASEGSPLDGGYCE